MSIRLRVLLATIAIMTGLSAVVWLLMQSDRAVAQQPPRVAATPTLGPSGQRPPFTYITPDAPPSQAPVTSHGQFRLLPYGYTGPLSQRSARVPSASLRATEDQAVVRLSSLFKQPTYVVPGYSLTQLGGTGAGDAETDVVLVYQGPKWRYTVRAARVGADVLDIRLPSPTSIQVVEKGQIGMAPAIFQYYRPDSVYAKEGNVRISFIRNGVYYEVAGDAIPKDELIKVAQSIPN